MKHENIDGGKMKGKKDNHNFKITLSVVLIAFALISAVVIAAEYNVKIILDEKQDAQLQKNMGKSGKSAESELNKIANEELGEQFDDEIINEIVSMFDEASELNDHKIWIQLRDAWDEILHPK
jgi:Na+-transporting NADH:ubiquinone oxidoreductase subunit NqrC